MRYIDRAELFNRLSNVKDLGEVFAVIQSMPAADVVKRVSRSRRPSDDLVKVVRCKDCKHADLFYPYCTIWEAAIDGDGYCYKGEKDE